MLEELLPNTVAVVEVRGNDPSAYLLPEETPLLGRAVEKRRRELTAGRTCARRALCKLGLPATPILRGDKREPIWPPGVVGSITHCHEYCAAAVALASDILTVGIDAEIHEALPSGVLGRVCVDREQAWLAEAPPKIHWDRLFFSVKESVYKAWFPLTHRWLDFKDAEVTFAPDHGTFRAQLLVTPPTVANQELAVFAGRFLVQDGLVLTAIALPQVQPLAVDC